MPQSEMLHVMRLLSYFFFFLMIRRPPRSTLFPYTRSSDLDFLDAEKHPPLHACPERSVQVRHRPQEELRAAFESEELERVEVEVRPLPVGQVDAPADRGPRHAPQRRRRKRALAQGAGEDEARAGAGRESLPDCACHTPAQVESVHLEEEAPAVIGGADGAAFERVDLQLGRDARAEHARLDEDVQLKGPARPQKSERQLLERLDALQLEARHGHVRHPDALVGEARQPEPAPERLELPLQLGLLEGVVLRAEIEPQAQGLERSAPDEDGLVESALVDVDRDLLALHARPHPGQPVAGPAQEDQQAGHHRARVGRRGLEPGGQLEHGAVHVLDQRHVAVKDERIGRGREQQEREEHQRSTRRTTKRSPDQVSSTAQTLLSTRPWARPYSRTTPSDKAVATPAVFLGQATHRPPLECSDLRSRGKSRASARRVWAKRTMTSASPRTRGTTPMVRAKSSGAPARRTRAPSLMPSFCGRGDPE